MSRERVAKGVRRDALAQTRTFGVALDDLPPSLPREPTAPTVAEQCRPLRRERRAPPYHPRVQGAAGHATDGHDALFRALADASHGALDQVDVVYVEVHQLGDPQPRRVQQLEH